MLVRAATRGAQHNSRQRSAIFLVRGSPVAREEVDEVLDVPAERRGSLKACCGAKQSDMDAEPHLVSNTKKWRSPLSSGT